MIKKIFKTLNKMEVLKQSEPKYSISIYPLMKYLKQKFNFQTGENY